MSLNKYSGSWTKREAGHLLRRTTYGHNLTELDQAEQLGLDGTLDELFILDPEPAPPINTDNILDVSIGSTWVNDIDRGNPTRFRRFSSMNAWHLDLIYNSGMRIREKMVMFWHNHFAMEYPNVADGRFLYRTMQKLRENASGNFKTLVELITVDASMLRYLDGRTNTKRAPNENYARELMELFTLGKGQLAGPGDYTTYTEEDILALAKALTGWRDNSYLQSDRTNLYYIDPSFRASLHDTTTKQLSNRFNNATIPDLGENEYKEVIRLIFLKREVSEFISRKLYRYFVATVIDDTVEAEIIQPLADIIEADNFEVARAIRTLLASEHFFFQLEVVGGLISNPVEFIMKFARNSGLGINNLDRIERTKYWERHLFRFRNMEMEMFRPPDVAGWKAYYLEPSFSELWLNSVTLKNRISTTTLLARANGFAGVTQQIKMNFVEFIGTLSDPMDLDSIIANLIEVYHAQDLTEDQKEALKKMITGDDGSISWVDVYQTYLNDPSDQSANRINSLLRPFFIEMVSIPEIHII